MKKPGISKRRVFLGSILAAGCGALLGGCGQKGPLFLPDEPIKDKKKQKTSALERRPALTG